MEFLNPLSHIFAAGVAAIVIAYVWYHKSVFGGPFMQMLNLSPEATERAIKRMPLMTLLALLSAMLAAYVMTFVFAAFQVYTIVGALDAALWLWVGFAAVPMLGMYLWEGKPFRYFLIVAGYWLVAFLTMGVILVMGSADHSFEHESYDASYPTTLE